MIKRTINISVYDCKIIVVFAADINDESRRIHKKHKIEYDEQAWDYACVISPAESVHIYYILFSTDYLDIKLFTHEITHLGATILGDRRHAITGDSEPLAYLNGYIAGELDKIMQKNNIEFVKKPKRNNGKNNKIHGKKISGQTTRESDGVATPLPSET